MSREWHFRDRKGDGSSVGVWVMLDLDWRLIALKTKMFQIESLCQGPEWGLLVVELASKLQPL